MAKAGQKQSASSAPHEDLSGTEDEDDLQIQRIFAEEILNYDVIGRLPPTPVPGGSRNRPCSVLSSASSSSFMSTPRKGGKGSSDRSPIFTSPFKSKSNQKKAKEPKKMGEEDICKALGIDIDEAELNDMEEKDDRVPVDNVIDDIINLGLGKGRKGKVKGGTAKVLSEEEEKLFGYHDKLRAKAPLEITSEGRCAVLKDDVQTVAKMKESVDALIAALEKTKLRLMTESTSLVYTEPPLVVKTKKQVHCGARKSS